MKNLIKALAFGLATIVSMSALASSGGANLDHANNDLTDKESLKNGFKTYINYCLGCHQLQYQRYNRTFKDLGIEDADGVENYMFTGEKPGDHITNTMPTKEAAKWFGTAPPDLTLEARLRSPDWIYTYLRSFYMDSERPFGVNNKVFKDVGMPHVLQDLQGVSSIDEHGTVSPAMGGSLTTEEYDVVVRDLTNFLEYVGEPSKLERKSMGVNVLIFLFIFFIVAYFLKKEYWKDIH
ncbi:cytochrome c1 [Candidatus Colwellia aromaticivorans]|uniref:cytochrome c1 n=1 Tax=Candidatus Colwellia aromaticivorans TaxID=2267621 RepID=UPI000DF1B8A9|nr:cytochrome c1 [Candidatus Colwellia aromaticivorans]